MVYGIISYKKGMGESCLHDLLLFSVSSINYFPCYSYRMFDSSSHPSQKDKITRAESSQPSTAATYICSFLPRNKGIVYLQQRRLFSGVFASGLS